MKGLKREIEKAYKKSTTKNARVPMPYAHAPCPARSSMYDEHVKRKGGKKKRRRKEEKKQTKAQTVT